jgi:hypothetical protein
MHFGGVFFFVAGAALGGACGYAVAPLIRAFRAWRRYREQRLVSCPETYAPAAVAVDVMAATRAAFRGAEAVRLCSCSRWPERAGCDQECVAQLEADPQGSRISKIVERWYAERRCAYCGRAIDAGDRVDNWLDHRPALLGAGESTIQWDDVAPELLPNRLAGAAAVCWSCHEAEAFRREFPDLVVERPGHH